MNPSTLLKIKLACGALGATVLAGSALLGGCSGANSGGFSPSAFSTDTTSNSLERSPGSGSAATAAASPSRTPAGAVPPALDNYIRRPEAAFKWQKIEAQVSTTGARVPDDAREMLQAAAKGASLSELSVTSQTWHGSVWQHRVQVFRPAKDEFPGRALLLISYGKGSDGETLFGQLVANAAGATFVNVFNVPNQPLFGLREDDLIAHTLAEYLKTGDATWPLLFPMTKSVVKAMDAVQAWSRESGHPIDKFMVGGASKRGWTSYLVGAVDPRVEGIVPMVYNNLNLSLQMPHQKEVWGGYSEQIEDYSRRGLQAQLQTDKGKQLAAMIDPWTYRDRLTMPKLLVLASNDRYWPLDALSLYREGLPGQTNIVAVPNVGHSLEGQEARAFGSVTAWFRRVAANQPIPAVTLEAADAPGGGKAFTVQTEGEVKSSRVWVAEAPTRDFRTAKWRSIEAEDGKVTLPKPDGAAHFGAAWAEIQLEGKPLPLLLSSPVVTWENK